MPGVLLGMPSLGRTEDPPAYEFWRLSIDHQGPSWVGETQFLLVSAKSFSSFPDLYSWGSQNPEGPVIIPRQNSL